MGIVIGRLGMISWQYCL